MRATRWRAGEIVALARRGRLADHRRRDADPGARRSAPSRTCARTSIAIVTVSEAEIAAGVRLAAERSRLVVEPSGALGHRGHSRSAPTSAGLAGSTGPVVAVVSGGNVDPDRYREYLDGADPGRADRRERAPGSA